MLETPGHTPESICLVVSDGEKSVAPWAVLTGDTLFIGDVGRPDLSPGHTPVELAGMLYDSLHEKLLKLADNVLVYPAHGAGSLCGKNMRAERWSTIGTERLTNSALQINSRMTPTQDRPVRHQSGCTGIAGASWHMDPTWKRISKLHAQRFGAK